MSFGHLFVRMTPVVMLALWAVATWLAPDSTEVALAFTCLMAVSLACSAVEVHEWREWKRRHPR
jgi:hypothetical protein